VTGRSPLKGIPADCETFIVRQNVAISYSGVGRSDSTEETLPR
jgi:hypothetical protein